MNLTDFIVEKAALLAELMRQGPVQINKDDAGNFSQLIWVTPHNLTFDEFDLIRKNGLDVYEVAPHESELMVWVMYPADIVKLNTPFPPTQTDDSTTDE